LGVATVEDDVEEDVDKQVWAAGFLPSPTASNNELISERARTIEQSLGVEQLEDDEESKYKKKQGFVSFFLLLFLIGDKKLNSSAEW